MRDPNSLDVMRDVDEEERAAWDRYYAALILEHTIPSAAVVADRMLFERRKRFGARGYRA